MEGVVVSAQAEGSTITISVVSDDKGQFRFPSAKIPAANYKLSIRAIGYDAYPWDRLKGRVALLVIHGDQDTTNPMDASKRMADAARAAGVDASYATVPGGTHLEAYLTYASPLFDFLDAHRK